VSLVLPPVKLDGNLFAPSAPLRRLKRKGHRRESKASRHRAGSSGVASLWSYAVSETGPRESGLSVSRSQIRLLARPLLALSDRPRQCGDPPHYASKQSSRQVTLGQS
jgi:hypothetical protein